MPPGRFTPPSALRGTDEPAAWLAREHSRQSRDDPPG
jgi:hypothetical protein